MDNKIASLTSCPNFRPIEKYVTLKNFNNGKFYRSDCLSKITKSEIILLEKAKIKNIIDLRDKDEIIKNPNPLSNDTLFKYNNISLLDNILIENFDHDIENNLILMYKQILEKNSDLIIKVIKIIIDDESYNILFHCVEGKDRTGIISTILLLIAEVIEDEIVLDYQVSYDNMKILYDKWDSESNEDELRNYGSPSKPECIISILRYINEEYGTIKNYLLNKGLLEEEYEKIRKLLFK